MRESGRRKEQNTHGKYCERNTEKERQRMKTT